MATRLQGGRKLTRRRGEIELARVIVGGGYDAGLITRKFLISAGRIRFRFLRKAVSQDV
jgi:hypothetical protein